MFGESAQTLVIMLPRSASAYLWGRIAVRSIFAKQRVARVFSTLTLHSCIGILLLGCASRSTQLREAYKLDPFICDLKMSEIYKGYTSDEGLADKYASMARCYPGGSPQYTAYMRQAADSLECAESDCRGKRREQRAWERFAAISAGTAMSGYANSLERSGQPAAAANIRDGTRQNLADLRTKQGIEATRERESRQTQSVSRLSEDLKLAQQRRGSSGTLAPTVNDCVYPYRISNDGSSIDPKFSAPGLINRCTVDIMARNCRASSDCSGARQVLMRAGGYIKTASYEFEHWEYCLASARFSAGGTCVWP